MTAEKLREIIEAAGFEPTDYSGRGMSGKQCIGMIIDNSMVKALADLVENCADCEEAAEVLRTATSDNMGRGTIIYWPRVKATA